MHQTGMDRLVQLESGNPDQEPQIILHWLKHIQSAN